MRRYIVLLLAFAQGCWLTIDGGRALIVGSYFTPASGKLGSWADLISTAGIAPGSIGMKSFYFACGLLWLAAFVGLVLRRAVSRWLAIIAGVATLWYIPFGTLIGIVVIILCFGRPCTAR